MLPPTLKINENKRGDTIFLQPKCIINNKHNDTVFFSRDNKEK